MGLFGNVLKSVSFGRGWLNSPRANEPDAWEKGEYYYGLGQSCRNSGDYGQAIEHLKTAISYGYGDACGLLGRIYMDDAKGEDSEIFNAQTVFDRGLELQSDLTAYYYGLELLGGAAVYGPSGFAIGSILRNPKKAIDLFEKASANGLGIASWKLGDLYENGVEVQVQLEKAYSCYKLAEERGVDVKEELRRLRPKLVEIAQFYYNRGNQASAFADKEQNYRKAMGLDYAAAYTELARLYQKETAGNHPVSEVLGLYQKAISLGHRNAPYYVAFLYYNGRSDLQRNYQEAFRWFLKGVSMGDVDCYWELGNLYQRGVGCTKNLAEARKYYGLYQAMATSYGNRDPQKAIAEIDRLLAEERKKTAAVKSGTGSANVTNIPSRVTPQGSGNAAAVQGTGGGRKPLTQDNKKTTVIPGRTNAVGENGLNAEEEKRRKAEEAKKQKAKQDNRDGYNASMIWENFPDSERGRAAGRQAVEYFRSAYAAGNGAATNNLGWCCYRGCGVEKDWEQARQLFLEAASHGNKSALFWLGEIYRQGDGKKILSDPVQARAYYEQSERVYAYYRLSEFYQLGQGGPKDPVKAFEYCQKALDEKCLPAYAKLGMFYEMGIGTEKNISLAVEQYQKGLNLLDKKKQEIEEKRTRGEQSRPIGEETTADLSWAAYRLGEIYRTGRKENKVRIPKDSERTLFYLNRAAAMGNARALLALGNIYRDNECGLTGNHVSEAIEFYQRAAALTQSHQVREEAAEAIHQLATEKGPEPYHPADWGEAKPYIFVSYASEDTEVAFDLIKRLQIRGYRVWFYMNGGVKLDENYQTILYERIKQCSCFLPIFSRDYFRKSECVLEMRNCMRMDRAKICTSVGGYPNNVIDLIPGDLKYQQIDMFTARNLEEIREKNLWSNFFKLSVDIVPEAKNCRF